ncbi:hypothetical protein [Phaeobacter sp. NW0010-22]|uniref:hypothetical protein n=1 Tax=Phaeobacter sp. NW0010-22 TaxID=3135907 RepID=UPI00333F8DDF
MRQKSQGFDAASQEFDPPLRRQYLAINSTVKTNIGVGLFRLSTSNALWFIDIHIVECFELFALM